MGKPPQSMPDHEVSRQHIESGIKAYIVATISTKTIASFAIELYLQSRGTNLTAKCAIQYFCTPAMTNFTAKELDWCPIPRLRFSLSTRHV